MKPKNFFHLTLFLPAVLVVSNLQTSQAAETTATLFQSHPYVAATTKEQHFEDNLVLRANQEKLPLTLTVKDGEEGHVGYNWFRLNIGGYLMASEKDMNGKKDASINVSGRMQPGGGQILIDAAGEPGATLSFTLTAPSVYITSLAPAAVTPGEHVVLIGRNFSSDETQDSVLIDSQPVEILSAGATSMTAVVPASLAPGKHTIRAVVDSLESQPLSFMVGAGARQPVLLSTNYWMAPPGARLVIKGQNFSPNVNDNQVYFKNVQAQIVAASSDTLTVIVPNWSYGPQQLNIALSVVSNGVRSANFLRFDFGAKYQGAWPDMPGDSNSEAPRN